MSHFKGVVPGLVKSLKDPEGIGRIQVLLPRLPGENRTFWASVAAPMAGSKRGFFFQPERDDEVLVAFDEGDPHHPYILGFLWNGMDKPPPGANDKVRRLRTVSGHVVEFDDRRGKEKILIKTQGKQQLELVDSPASITIKTSAGQKITVEDNPAGKIEVATSSGAQTITLSDTDNSIRLQGGGRTITMMGGSVQIQ
jgi:uncharacterized protein involved in type VI secretion and phage assembly